MEKVVFKYIPGLKKHLATKGNSNIETAINFYINPICI